ncbi:MAG TPA: hypothetical protein PLL09_10025 [Flavobacterium sp.]|uniref:hypothetical protein n=1 Tax=unclassified Flavobacterium TaxID=196869 RepID=UPI000E8B9F80|nr:MULTISPECIES: hypothetical protein [unclassified Flavobacterium]HBI00915.1 hypothetical protein [Flavobacterium sp.]HRE78147.1 hypothetical protein [Flavobacterium sp.]
MTFQLGWFFGLIQPKSVRFLLLFTIFFLSSVVLCYGQQKQQRKIVNVYTLHHQWPHQDKVIVPIGTKKVKLKAGWTITEEIAGITIQRTLENDTLISTPRDSTVTVLSNWKIAGIKYTAESPGKIYLSPVPFIEESDAPLNQMVYISLPVHEELLLTHLHTKWSAITIPFTIRPAIKNRLNSQVTSELKIGTSFSLNYDWEYYKNRRLDIKTRTYGISAGLGFGLGRVKLDEGSTQLSGANYTNEEEGLILFITPGVGLNIRGFKVLGFYGWDIGLTKNTNDWNYNRKPYIGIGLGFDFWTLKR